MKKIFIRSAKFLIIIGILQGLLCLSALIPTDRINVNMKKSGEYFHEQSMLPMLIDGSECSMLHTFADEVILSIAYYMNPEEPLNSAVWAYYYIDGEQLNDSLLSAVSNRIPPNREYLRYWHGAVTILRPLHLILSVKKIKILNGILLFILATVLVGLLWKTDFCLEAINFIISLVLVSAWVVPFCLEYTWSFLCMLVFSIVAVFMELKDKCSSFLFFVSGMITVYFDFLTTETLSLLIPLLLVLRIREKKAENEADTTYAFKSCLSWLVGYASTWGAKWLIAAAVTKQNSLLFVSEHINERLSGSANMPLPEYLWQAIAMNFKKLFFFDYGLVGAVILLLIIIVGFIIVCTNSIEIKKHVNLYQISLYAALGMIPYIRFIVLRNHSYCHSFFTYRAQMASVMALVFIGAELFQRASARKIK